MKLFPFLILIFFSSPALALNVKEYRDLLTKSVDGKLDPIAEAYLDGVAETLTAQRQKDTGKIVFIQAGKPYELCPPQVMPLRGKTIKSIVEFQLKKGDEYAEKFGSEFEELPISALVISGLKRMFVCTP
jgi:hypothetical protein